MSWLVGLIRSDSEVQKAVIDTLTTASQAAAKEQTLRACRFLSAAAADTLADLTSMVAGSMAGSVLRNLLKASDDVSAKLDRLIMEPSQTGLRIAKEVLDQSENGGLDSETSERLCFAINKLEEAYSLATRVPEKQYLHLVQGLCEKEIGSQKFARLHLSESRSLFEKERSLMQARSDVLFKAILSSITKVSPLDHRFSAALESSKRPDSTMYEMSLKEASRISDLIIFDWGWTELRGFAFRQPLIDHEFKNPCGDPSCSLSYRRRRVKEYFELFLRAKSKHYYFNHLIEFVDGGSGSGICAHTLARNTIDLFPAIHRDGIRDVMTTTLDQFCT